MLKKLRILHGISLATLVFAGCRSEKPDAVHA
jgi:hypothetical protein